MMRGSLSHTPSKLPSSSTSTSTATILTFLCPLLLLTSASLFGNKVAPQRASYDVPTVHIATLPETMLKGENVWIKVRIIQQTDTDTYLVQDKSGQIILFLSNDELLNLDLEPAQEILAWGKIDVSQVHPSKNEFYADRILLPR